MQDNPPSTSLGFLISDTARLLRKRFDQRAREIGLTRAQWQVLAFLKHNEGINQVGLADLMEVEPITLSRHIEKMEEAGWVARRPDPNDKRGKQLFLSERSGAVLDAMRVIARGLFDEALAGLAPKRWSTRSRLCSISVPRLPPVRVWKRWRRLWVSRYEESCTMSDGPEEEVGAPASRRRRFFSRRTLMFVVPIVLAIVGGYFWLFGGRYASTDNAYVQRDTVAIVTEVAGRITDVAVTENQHVERGDLLFRIDPEAYRIALQQAEAAVAAARMQVEQMRATFIPPRRS